MIEWLSQINPNDLVKASFGGIVGFVLAQLFNVAKVVREAIIRPKLEISSRLQAHVNSDTILSSEQRLKEVTISVRVTNIGKRVAVNVQCFVVNFEVRDILVGPFTPIGNRIVPLPVIDETSGKDDSTALRALIPQASISIAIARWKILVATRKVEKPNGDEFITRPAAIPYAYLRQCLPPGGRYLPEATALAQGNKQFRVTIAAFGDDRKVFTQTVTFTNEVIPKNFGF